MTCHRFWEPWILGEPNSSQVWKLHKDMRKNKSPDCISQLICYEFSICHGLQMTVLVLAGVDPMKSCAVVTGYRYLQ